MVDSAPAHIGDVKQAIQTIEVNECSEISDILHRAFTNISRRHFSQQFGTFFGPFLFDELPARKDDILALLIDLDDLVFVSAAHVRGQTLGRSDVNLRSGQESLDPDIDQQATLDHSLDTTRNGAALIADTEDFLPVLFKLSFFLGKDHHAFAILQALDEHVYDISGVDRLDVVKFVPGNRSFAFVADVDEHFLAADFDDRSFDNVTSSKIHRTLLHGFFHGKHNYFCL